MPSPNWNICFRERLSVFALNHQVYKSRSIVHQLHTTTFGQSLCVSCKKEERWNIKDSTSSLWLAVAELNRHENRRQLCSPDTARCQQATPRLIAPQRLITHKVKCCLCPLIVYLEPKIVSLRVLFCTGKYKRKRELLLTPSKHRLWYFHASCPLLVCVWA